MAKIRRATAALFVIALAAAIPAHADPVTIRIGWQAPPDKFLPMVANMSKVVPHNGHSYRVELIRFGASSAQITALATDQIDLASYGYSSFALAVENANLKDLRVVLDSGQDGVPGYFSAEFAVLKSSGITTIEGLKGKVLVANGPGSSGDIAIREMMRRHGMEDKRDYTLISGPSNNQFPMLAERKADLVTISRTQATDPKVLAAISVLFRARDAFNGVTQWALYAARAGFLAKHRAAFQDFIDDTIRVTRWEFDPRHREEAIELLAKFTKRPAEVYRDYAFTRHDIYQDLDGKPDVAALQSNVDIMHGLGFLKAALDVKPYIDLSFVDSAASRLGPAKP